LPLTQVVEFKTRLQKGNRIQVPRLIRWQFKLEPDQVLKIEISSASCFVMGRETFYGQMNKDGRITIPYLTREIIRKHLRDQSTINNILLQVRLNPT